MKGVDHAVADEPVMIGIARRELRIGAVAVERAGEVLRQRAAKRQVGRVSLEGKRRIIAGEEWIGGERLAHDASSSCARLKRNRLGTVTDSRRPRTDQNPRPMFYHMQ
jgi:hypothetical protein